jgi:hypothetical protein
MRCGYRLRSPFLIISLISKVNYVHYHILKFIEDKVGGLNLTWIPCIEVIDINLIKDSLILNYI